jgi:3-oxoadipate enol-lactonase
MPYTTSPDGTHLYWEAHGSGDPVLLITGLGASAHAWHRTLPWLAARHRVLVMDNRGTGRSDAPSGAYTTGAMAADAVAVLDAAGERTAHVVGASLGGMIAQRVALAHPGRVRSLVLVCTSPGGPHAVPVSPEVAAAMAERHADPGTAYRRNAWFLYGAATRADHPERIEEDLAQRLRLPTPPAGYAGQVEAIRGHDAWDALPALAVPTLVVHGEADALVPAANGVLLAGRIPGARLVLVPGAGHMLQTDAGDAVRDAILAFLG